MSATFIERCIRVGDYENDGGIIDIEDLEDHLHLLESGDITTADIETRFSLTTAQRTQLDDIVATLPAVTTAADAAARAGWVHRVFGVLRLGVRGHTDYDTDAKCATALGL